MTTLMKNTDGAPLYKTVACVFRRDCGLGGSPVSQDNLVGQNIRPLSYRTCVSLRCASSSQQDTSNAHTGQTSHRPSCHLLHGESLHGKPPQNPTAESLTGSCSGSLFNAPNDIYIYISWGILMGRDRPHVGVSMGSMLSRRQSRGVFL